jgi:hypothetical protein
MFSQNPWLSLIDIAEIWVKNYKEVMHNKDAAVFKSNVGAIDGSVHTVEEAEELLKKAEGRVETLRKMAQGKEISLDEYTSLKLSPPFNKNPLVLSYSLVNPQHFVDGHSIPISKL